MSITTKTPIAMFLRKGTIADPYVFITETNRRISDGGTLVLQEFPINQTGYVNFGNGSPVEDAVAVSVIVDGTPFSEIKDPSATLTTNQFRVDYEFGLLSFNPELYGAEIVDTITYVGRGAFFIASSRIYNDQSYIDDSQFPIQTLQDVLDQVQAINVVETITGAPFTDADVTVDGTSFTFTVPRGNPFYISVEYPSVADLIAGTNSIPSGYEKELFDLAIITSNVEDADNAKLYIYDEGPNEIGGGWSFISDLSGATGPMRPLRWKPSEPSTLQWQENDGITWSNDKDLSSTASFSGTQLTITRNSDNTQVSKDLGFTASFDDSELIITRNHDQSTAAADLGLNFSFDADELTISSNLLDINSDPLYSESVNLGLEYNFNGTILEINDKIGGPVIDQELGVYAEFGGEELTDTTLVLTNPDNSTIQQELGVYASFDGTELTLTNPDNTTVAQELALLFDWDGTALGIKNPADSDPFDYVDLKGDKGDPFTIDVVYTNDIDVTYPTVADLNNNTNPDPEAYTPIFLDIALVEDDLYIYDGVNWNLLTDSIGISKALYDIENRTVDDIAWVQGNSRSLLNNIDGGDPTSTFEGEIVPDKIYVLQEVNEIRVWTELGSFSATGPQGPQGPQGPASLIWQDSWSPVVTYVLNDVVEYLGSSYVCIDPFLLGVLNIAPTDTEYWSPLALKGDKGDTGEKGDKGDQGEPGDTPEIPIETITVDDELVDIVNKNVNIDLSGKADLDDITGLVVSSQLPELLELGETSTTAHRGDHGKSAYDHSLLTTGNPHQVSANDVGLGNVTNESKTTMFTDPTFTGDTSGVNRIKEQRIGTELKIWQGTQAQYDEISEKDANTLYFVI